MDLTRYSEQLELSGGPLDGSMLSDVLSTVPVSAHPKVEHESTPLRIYVTRDLRQLVLPTCLFASGQSLAGGPLGYLHHIYELCDRRLVYRGLGYE